MMDESDNLNGAIVHLSSDEAVVLFELLSRWTHDSRDETPNRACFVSSGECAALHGLLENLKGQLSELSGTDYPGMVEGARERLSHYWEGLSLRPIIVR
jgi:hypothetical protein